MEIIKLTTKPQTLEAIKAGLLREYTREIRPNTQKKYCDLDEGGSLFRLMRAFQAKKRGKKPKTEQAEAKKA